MFKVLEKGCSKASFSWTRSNLLGAKISTCQYHLDRLSNRSTNVAINIKASKQQTARRHQKGTSNQHETRNADVKNVKCYSKLGSTKNQKAEGGERFFKQRNPRKAKLAATEKKHITKKLKNVVFDPKIPTNKAPMSKQKDATTSAPQTTNDTDLISAEVAPPKRHARHHRSLNPGAEQRTMSSHVNLTFQKARYQLAYHIKNG